MITQDTEQTTVLFRIWKDKTRDLIALFPDIQAGDAQDSNRVQSYMHIGQHSGADYIHVIRITRPAKPSEYADLKAELESIGYNLKVAKRRV